VVGIIQRVLVAQEGQARQNGRRGDRRPQVRLKKKLT